jgi:hypothetical protein
MDHRRLFMLACAVCLSALGGGCFLIVFWGGEVPDWLLRGELAVFCSVALVYGFTASLPALAPWLWSRPVKGAACVCLGVAAIFVPLSFVVAALFIALGTRLIWLSACDLTPQEREPFPANVTASAAMPQIAEDEEPALAMRP